MNTSIAALKRSKSNLDTLIGELSKVAEPQKQKNSYQDDRFWKPELDKSGNGYAVLRFLPAVKDEDLPWARLWSHAFQGPGGWYIENSLTTLNKKIQLVNQIVYYGTLALRQTKRLQEREKENSTLARFMRNLESRVYAELSRQLVNNLFGETPSDSGIIELEGNIIEYTSDGVTLTLKITEADGTVTEITIPIGTFTF